MPKRVLVFTFSDYDWPEYYKILNEILRGQDIEIVMDSVKEFRNQYEGVDLVLTSGRECGVFIASKIPPEIPVLWINHTLTNEVFDKIQAMCEQGPISIAADTVYYAEQRKRMLISLGLPEQCFRVWGQEYGEEKLERRILQYEDTPLKNKERYEIVSIHGRGVISTDTLIQMLLCLNRLDVTMSPCFQKYMKSVRPYLMRITDMTDIGTYYSYQKKFGVRNGCLLYTSDYQVYFCDENAAYILGLEMREVIGRNFFELLPTLKEEKDRLSKGIEKIIFYRGQRLIIRIWTSCTHEEAQGYVLLADYHEEQRKEWRIRKNSLNKTHMAKYTFQSIQGNSLSIKKCKEQAKRMAGSSASTLIIGPSGSGKELFAQAIHNHSPRHKFPFVSINCGAIVESLLESELFGYVGGAFTGAAKEGKAGVFELAHRGSLFLDEIGELPLGLQVKLLRVLQEKEIVRVGSHEIIPVDVRIIAATNRDLKQLVHEGKFRLDLYYRLNVLPLYLPGLNDRREDILPLFYSMIEKKNYRFCVREDALDYIVRHNYEGNVRELQNCVEYLGSLGCSEITVDDLPPYMIYEENPTLKMPEKNDTQWVLYAIREINSTGVGAGRRSIHSYLLNHGKNISEMKIRKILQLLEEQEKIIVQNGRGGIRLT